MSCGLTLLAIVQNNPDLMSKYSKKCIPFVFFGMHQQNETQMKIKQQQLEQQQQNQFKSVNTESSNGSVWESVWEEITSGTEYAIKANLNDILQIVKTGLEHQSWKLRIQSALSICTICTKLQSKIDIEHLNELITMLISALNVRNWTGKDKILIAVSCLFINCK